MIRRARRDGREARGNEDREKREIEKGSRERIEKRERDKQIELFFLPRSGPAIQPLFLQFLRA